MDRQRWDFPAINPLLFTGIRKRIVLPMMLCIQTCRQQERIEAMAQPRAFLQWNLLQMSLLTRWEWTL